MKHCVRNKNFITAALSLLATVAAFSLGSCTREGDSTLGFEFLPENQRMQTRHKSFAAGVVRRYDAKKGEYVNSEGHRLFSTTHYRTDSLVSSNLQIGYFGVQRDPEGIFGLREAGFASEFLYTELPGEKGFGYLPIFDSMRILLSVTDHDGDTLRPIRYEVYEITGKTITESMAAANGGDTIAYINHNMSDLYDPSKPIFTFTFPDPENKIYTSAGAVTMKPVDLSENGATWNFVKRLLLVEDLDKGWDGYALDTLVYSVDKWMDEFKGIYIKPADDLADGKEGGMYATDLSSSGLYLYGRNRNPKEPRLIQDTITLGYRFYISDASIGNNSINYVSHDYKGSELANAMSFTDRKREADDTNIYAWRDENRHKHVESGKVYVEGMGGAVTELYFTDDFLKELRNLSADEDYSLASVNQALMYVYLDGSDYDWTMLDPVQITPLLESAHSRLGLYTNFETLSPITDYNYYYEATYNTELNYDGYLKRSLGCYVMDISSYIQNLKSYVDYLNPDADDDFVYEGKFNSTYDKAVTRTLYLAPEAYSQFSLKRTSLQGMEDALNNASIRIELTYTMVK